MSMKSLATLLLVLVAGLAGAAERTREQTFTYTMLTNDQLPYVIMAAKAVTRAPTLAPDALDVTAALLAERAATRNTSGQDIDASAWWTLTLLLPIGNLIAFLVLAFKRGDAGPNRFGPPRPTADWERVLGILYIALIVLGLVGVVAALLIPAILGHQLGLPQG